MVLLEPDVELMESMVGISLYIESWASLSYLLEMLSMLKMLQMRMLLSLRRKSKPRMSDDQACAGS
jgi:hypothetical protein